MIGLAVKSAGLALLISIASGISTGSLQPQPGNSNAIPGQSSLFSTYQGKVTPLAAQYLRPIEPTETGDAGEDDVLFQNLLSAEWLIYDFYQQGVDIFNAESFIALGLPNTTYERLNEIRNNEAGHVRLFQDGISATSVKPGPCTYKFPVVDVQSYLAIHTLLETSSMAFLTGLITQAKTATTRSILMGIGQVESRHNAWSLSNIYDTDPFSGPIDTIFPYGSLLLHSARQFIVPGSCPPANPQFPLPDTPDLPPLAFDPLTTTGQPGSNITFVFPDLTNQPRFNPHQEYYAIYFHGAYNISEPLDLNGYHSTIPAEFDQEAGIILVVVADQPGAPTEKSVIAGPLTLVEQPSILTKVLV